MPGRKAGSVGGDLFVARQSFATTLNDETVIIQAGQVVDAADPVLKGRQELFDPFAPNIRQYKGQRVEQATAAPGEKRDR